MIRQVILGCLVVISGAAYASAQVSQPERGVGLKYASPDGQTVEVVGVGTISPVKCKFWDTQGQNDVGLTQKVEGYLRKYNFREFPFDFGQKYRYVVFKVANPNSNVTYPGANLIGRIGYLEGSPWDPVYDIVEVAVPADQKTLDIGALVDGLSPETLELPFKVGSIGLLAEIRFEVGRESSQYPRQTYGGMGGQSLMSIPFEVRPYFSIKLGKSSPVSDPTNAGRPQKLMTELVYNLLDHNKKSIVWVDSKGRPQPQPSDVAQALKLFQLNRYPSNVDETLLRPYACYARDEYGGLVTLYINVDPKEIGWMRISLIKRTRAIFEGIPLEMSLTHQ